MVIGDYGDMGTRCEKVFLASGENCPLEAVKDGRCLMHSGATIDYDHIKEHLSSLKYSFEGKIYLDFSDIKFRKGVVFDSGILPRHDVVFFNDCIFNECTFKGCLLHDAHFDRATFSDTFFKECDFAGKILSLNECTFNLGANSGNSIIFGYCGIDVKLLKLMQIRWHCEQMPFAMCSLSAEEIDLSSAHIYDDYLSIGIWQGQEGNFNKFHMILNNPKILDLSGLIFEGNFRYGFWPGRQDAFPKVYFNHINFANMKSAKFVNANLERALFSDSDIENVLFNKPIWPKEKNRNILYEDLENTPNTGYFELKRLYLQLKKNYEDRRDYDTASDWHFREMEARRKTLSHGWHWFTWLRQNIFSFIAMYRNISCYGESYIRPLFLIFALWFIWSWLYLLSGFQIDGINSNFDILNAFLYSFSNITFQRSDIFTTTSGLTELLNISQKLLVTLFFSLFLLALRRRFRR